MPLENVRDFIVRTLLQDEASKGLDNLLAKAAALTGKTYAIAVDVTTTQAEKAIKNVEEAGKKAADIDTSKATRGLKEQDRATTGLGDSLKSLTEQSQKAGDTIGNFFSRLDAGKLVIAGAAMGMVHYAKSALQVAESARLNIDMIKEQLGGQAAGALSFISAGDQGFGTSSLTRANLEAYMTMTGYNDQDVIQKNVLNAEKIMRSKWGQSLAGFGITDEKQLLQTLSGPIDPTSDVGRVMAQVAPALFQQGALEREKMLVMREPKYANIINTQYGQAVVEQEARRRMASTAMETIAAPLEDDTDSYRVRMRDFSRSFESLNAAIGNAVRPAASIVLQLMTTVTRLLALAPEVPALITVMLGLGAAFATLPPILSLAAVGVKAFTLALLTNPVGLAIAAILALAIAVTALETRFGVFSKAWEHFAQSEIGKDLIAGFNELLKSLGMFEGTDFMGGLGEGIEFITSRVADLFDKLDAVYKMAKGGDILGAMRGGMEVALRITPIGMALAITEGMMPQKRVQDLILWVLQKANDTWNGFIRWLQDIYDGIRGLLDPLVGIYNTVKGLYDKYFGSVPKTPEETQKRLIEALDKHIATRNERTTPEQKEWLARYAMGEETPMGMTSHQVGVSTHQIEAAREEYEKLMSGQSTAKPLISTPAAIQEADKKINEIAREGQEKADEAIANRDFVGFMANQYYMGAHVIGAMGGGLVDWITGGKKYATGGEVTKSGLAWVDEGEPIVPAEVARDSNLIDLLRGASEGGGGAGGNFTIQNLNVSVPAGSSDPYTFARQFRDALVNELDNPAVKAKIEQVYHRANRGYIG